MRLFVALLLGILITPSFAQTPGEQPAAGFSVENIDKSQDPCVDFYQYACGNWLKKAEIPADRSSWVSFEEIEERNLSTGRNPVDQKIGDYYGACMDEKVVDAKGLDPLKPELDRIAAASDKSALIEAVARVHLIVPNRLLRFYSSPDLH